MIKNLKESIKMLTEESLADRLENEMGIDPTQASDAVKELGFTEYLEVAAALEDGDQTRVRELLGLGLEEDYTKAKVTDVRPGQEVTYQDDKGRETTVDLRDPDHELGLSVLDMSGNRPATDERGEDVTPNAKEIERGDEFMIDLEEGIDWPEDLDYEAEAYNAIRHYSYASDAYDYLFGAFYPNVQWIRDNEEALLKLFTDHGLKGSSDGLDEMKQLAGIEPDSLEDWKDSYNKGYIDDEDCETCGGWGEVSSEGKHWRDTEFSDPTMPCPDCNPVEETTAGAVASVAMPMGKMIKRKK